MTSQTGPVPEPPPGTDRDAIFAANRAHGRVDLAVKAHGGVTRRAHVHEAGSLRVRCPNTTSSEMEAVLINTAGGVAGGDRFALDVAVGENASLVVTTAAAEKVYRAIGTDSVIDVSLDVATGGSLAWLPQETILFDRARLSRAKPPSGLVVACETGAKYSGVLLVADNRVVGGATHCTFDAEPQREPYRRFESGPLFDGEGDTWR